ncbi:MAG: ABC transporter permease [Gemmataceae bacterium]
MPIWTLAKKDLRLLLRDPRAGIILLAMPFLWILVLGLILGEGFGQKPDDRLRVALVDLDEGYLGPKEVRAHAAWLMLAPGPGSVNFPAQVASVASFQQALPEFVPWSRIVQRDLVQTGGIRVEVIATHAEAERLVRQRRRAAILVFGPEFSQRVQECSFLADGRNPFFRDGVQIEELDAHMLEDDTQKTAASIIEQVVQVTLLRVVLPWMIGRAFEKIGDPAFIDLLGQRVEVPVPVLGRMRLDRLLTTVQQKQAVGEGVQDAIAELFPKYNLTGKTWADLTRSEPARDTGTTAIRFRDEGGIGVLRRGAVLYQTLVPSATVAFAFFLVLTMGWLFTSERRQGTFKRLRAAPLTRVEILLGKLASCLTISIAQGFLLLLAGKLVFGMDWGKQPALLVPVVVTTSLAAMGLALFVATLARTETQVAIYGTLLVLLLAVLGGCLIPREVIPENMQPLTLITPHGWALSAYKELLSEQTNLAIVAQACAVLTAFGISLVALSWGILRVREE